MTRYYEGAEHEVYIEAIRSIPGMIACMDEKRNADGRTLLTGYFSIGNKKGVSREGCWSILFTACMHWIDNLTEQIAGHVEIEPIAAARQMGALAGLWETESQA